MERKEILNDDVLEQIENFSLDSFKEDDKKDKERYEIDEKIQKRITTLAQRTRKEPWGNHRELKDDIPKIEFITHLCKKLANKDLKKGAALTILYLSVSRIGEILGNTFNDGSVWKGVRLGDIQFIEDKSGDYIQLKTIIEKLKINKNAGKDGQKYKLFFKYSYIPVDEMYKPLIEILWDYIEQEFKDEISPDTPLFEGLNYDSLWSYIQTNVGPYNFHIFRHWRTSHLAHYHNYKEVDLRNTIGWDKKSDMPTTYVHSSKDILINKMRKNFNFLG